MKASTAAELVASDEVDTRRGQRLLRRINRSLKRQERALTQSVGLAGRPWFQHMIYAPGTFVRGNSMSLDLGVVRESVLNSTNDHTAAWAEDCYALLKPGHESRVVTVDICGSGEIGERSITCLGS